MTSEEKVKQLWPGATIDREGPKAFSNNRYFRVTIKPGRYAYGLKQNWAWKAAWESIIQDEELIRGAAVQPPPSPDIGGEG